MGFFKNFFSFVSFRNFLISNKRRFRLYFWLILLFLLILHRFYFVDIASEYLAAKVFDIILFYLVLMVMTNFLRIFIISTYRKRNKFVVDYIDNIIVGIGVVSTILMHIIFFFGFLYLLDIGITTFLTSIGLFSVGIAIIFNKYISNTIDGIILLFSKNYKIRDYVGIKEYKGYILNVGFLHTKLKNDEGDIVYVPNTEILNMEVVNFSKSKVKKIRIDFQLPRNIFGKLQQLEKHVLKNLEENFSDLVKLDDVIFRIDKIEESSTTINLEIPVSRYNFKIEDRIKKEVSMLILDFVSK